MTTVTPTENFASQEGFALRIPSRIRIARAIAFGLMTVPLTMLFSASSGSPFDQIACAFQIGVIFALFQAGVGRRTGRIAALEIAALAMMVVLDLRMLSVGPDPVMTGGAALYAPLLIAAAVTATATLGLLLGHSLAGLGERAYHAD